MYRLMEGIGKPKNFSPPALNHSYTGWAKEKVPFHETRNYQKKKSSTLSLWKHDGVVSHIVCKYWPVSDIGSLARRP